MRVGERELKGRLEEKDGKVKYEKEMERLAEDVVTAGEKRRQKDGKRGKTVGEEEVTERMVKGKKKEGGSRGGGKETEGTRTGRRGVVDGKREVETKGRGKMGKKEGERKKMESVVDGSEDGSIGRLESDARSWRVTDRRARRGEVGDREGERMRKEEGVEEESKVGIRGVRGVGEMKVNRRGSGVEEEKKRRKVV